ncbi:protein phosphatase 2C domain-containing protein, partial [uncultured Hydrogenophaga sp.]
MSKGYRILASTGIHKGDRDYQQDQVELMQHTRIPNCLLAVLADGMGGRSGGRKASDQVMLTARQLFNRFDPETDDPRALLKQIVNESHMVIKLTAVSAEQEPHSTVAAFLLLPNGESHWAHAGDSRVYHFRQGKLL